MSDQSSNSPNFPLINSSSGWTNEKHMHYLSSLEDSFVNQLYDSGCSLDGSLCLSMGAEGCSASVSQDCDQVLHQESCVGSLFVYCGDKNSSTAEPMKRNGRSCAREMLSIQASCCRIKYYHLVCESKEASDQNFVDEDTSAAPSSRLICKRRKSRRQQAGPRKPQAPASI